MLYRITFITIAALGGVCAGFMLQRMAYARLWGKIGESRYRLLRSPADDILGGIVAVVGNSRRSIKVCARTLNSEALASALFEAKRRGVNVRIILSPDTNPTATRGAAKILKTGGLDVRWAPEPMTDQFVIVDGKLVLFGSMPWDARVGGTIESTMQAFESEGMAGAYASIFDERYRNSAASIDSR